MSASTSRVRDSIRRIALSDPDIRALLDDYKNRGGIASDSIDIEGAADGRSICCDGSTSSGTPGSSTRDPDADGAGQDASDGLDPNDPANLDMGEGSLIGVKDCATGEPVCFEGSDWLPPPEWDGPTSPPLRDDYDEGFYWEISGSEEVQPFYTAFSLPSQFAPHCYERIDENTVNILGSRTFGDCISVDAVATRTGCTDSDPDWLCDPEDIYKKEWPEDGCINLSTKGGKLIASKYDPEAQGTSYLKGVGEIELCDDFGNQFSLSASGSVEGGWKTIDSSNPGDGYLYNAQGEQIARISASEYSDPSV